MDGRLKLAHALMNARNYASATQVLGQHLARHPDSAEALYLLGTAQYRRQEHPAAVRTFTRLVSLRPDDVQAAYSLGISLLAVDRPEDARREMERTLALDPGFMPARRRLAEMGIGPSTPPHTAQQDAPGSAPAGTVVSGAGELLVSAGRAVTSLVGRFASATALGILGLFLVVRRSDAGLDGVAEFFFLVPGRPVSDLRDQLAFMQRSGASEAQLAAVRAELANAEAALADTVDQLATGLQVIGAVLALGAVLVVLHGVLLAWSTRYRVFQNRIDIHEGVVVRRLDSVWLYQLAGVHFEQPLWLALFGHARLRLTTDKVDRRGRPVTRTIVGMTRIRPPVSERPAAFMEDLFHELRDQALSQGVAIKKFWVQ